MSGVTRHDADLRPQKHGMVLLERAHRGKVRGPAAYVAGARRELEGLCTFDLFDRFVLKLWRTDPARVRPMARLGLRFQ